MNQTTLCSNIECRRICKVDHYFITICGHVLCRDCVQMKGRDFTCMHPGCSRKLNETLLDLFTKEEDTLREEIELRKRLSKIFNTPRDRFQTVQDYELYLEEIEDIVYEYIHGDREKARESIERYQRKNDANIKIFNQMRTKDEERRRRDLEKLILEDRLKNQPVASTETEMEIDSSTNGPNPRKRKADEGDAPVNSQLNQLQQQNEQANNAPSGVNASMAPNPNAIPAPSNSAGQPFNPAFQALFLQDWVRGVRNGEPEQETFIERVAREDEVSFSEKAANYRLDSLASQIARAEAIQVFRFAKAR
eukprot:TRINITY_DN4300_c0_g1_i1.p1 TRINITY_DN4300_c0_g1~~TRINITY_DN4300_c0_g1_i1.p1  ORF type:complete len:307 (+),score=71.30 TRINITY_DN4300_c0_g1_i1:77-997(+)